MNERVKELRQALRLSGEKFGESLGVNHSAISKIENGKTNLTDQMIKSICLAYNVNEDWLRNGNGSMFNQSKDDYLSDLQKQFGLTDFQKKLVKTYLELTPDQRSFMDKFIASCSNHSDDNEVQDV